MSDFVTTPNLGLIKPTVFGDLNQWGGHLNSNADTLDAEIHARLASKTASQVLNLAGAAEASAAAQLIGWTSPVPNVLMLQVKATTPAADPNYTLELFDGNPTAGGALVYQATGITVSPYNDNASFYIDAPASGTLWAKATNIDAVLMALTVAIRLQDVR